MDEFDDRGGYDVGDGCRIALAAAGEIPANPWVYPTIDAVGGTDTGAI